MELDQKTKLINRLTSRKGLRSRINAKCIDCVYESSNGGGSWRKQVELCTVTKCPLWDVRPTSTPSGGDLADDDSIGGDDGTDSETATLCE